MANQDRPGPSRAFGDANQSPNESGQLSRPVYMESVIDLYLLSSKLGEGTFGKVYKAYAEKSRQHVAVKLFNSTNRGDPSREYDICKLFRGVDNFVQAVDRFEYQGRQCIVFELIQETFSNFITKFAPFTMKDVRPLLQQLLEALRFLKVRSIIHCDIKPQNIMLNHWSSKGRILKIIDFGTSIYKPHTRRNYLIQTRPYRAPEVILGAPRSEKVDMWSCGCIIAEMLTSRVLYPATSDKEQLTMMTNCQGPLPANLLIQGSTTYHFYTVRTGMDRQLVFQLSRGPTLQTVPSSSDRFVYQPTSINALVEYDFSATSEEKKQMLSLIMLMLALDPDLRCSPEMALSHPFLTLGGNEAPGDRR